MNKRIKYNKFAALLTTMAILLMLGSTFELSAQAKQAQVKAQVKQAQVKNRKGMGAVSATDGTEKRKVAVPEFWISGTVTSPDGKPVANALITANEGAIVLRSGNNGQFKVKAKEASSLLIEATGFEPLTYEIKQEANDLKLTLSTATLYAGQADVVNLPSDVQEKQRYLVGAVSGIQGDKLTSFSEPLLSNTLQGQILGLNATLTVNGLGNNNADLRVRGNSRNSGNNSIVTLVDGVERDIDELLLDEVASVEVMKDATAKILYGSRAANGVLLVTTKHGKKFTRKINVTAETGAGLPISLPKYLNSYQYALLYNEARSNDGLPPMYSAADLKGYRNSSGPNDLRYPDVDYMNYFLNKSIQYRKVTLEFSGGNENAQYALIVGYNGNTGLQKIGPTPTRDWYNVRGNLDMKITDHFSAFVGMGGVFDVTNRSGIDHATAFSRINQTRPNEFPLTIDPSRIPVDTLGHPALGASYARNDNLYGALMYGGQYNQNIMNGQLTLGVKLDMSQYVKGLSLKAQLGFDNYFTGVETVATNQIASYAQRWSYDPVSGIDTVMFQQLRKTVINTGDNLTSQFTARTTSYLMGMDYGRIFNKDHRVSANLFYAYQMQEQTGITANIQSANTALRGNYSFKDKYTAEVDLALMGSDRFRNNEYFMSYAGGLGWILSDEDFLKENATVNYLKLKASGGLLGYDAQTPQNLYSTRWSDDGSYNLRGSTSAFNLVTLSNVANPNLKWEQSLEFNVGAEGLLFNRKLWVEANYFNETRSNIISDAGSVYSALYGGIYGQMNIGKVSNQGFELEAKYMNKSGDFFYSIGINGTYSKNKLLATNEVIYPDAYRNVTGKPTDAMFGYVSQGLFGKNVDLASHLPQTLGYYTIGDIAYADLNGDKVIDSNDQKMIGNAYPRVQLGLSVDLSWKGFGMSLLGVSSLGDYIWLNNNYYWNYGENKWSDIALNRYNPLTNPGGTYPRLTTTAGSNNFVNSTFWLANSSFGRLKNAELSYTFGYDKPLTTSLKTIKVFMRGTNVFTISGVKGLDPEVPNAGVTNYPLFSTYTAGLSATF